MASKPENQHLNRFGGEQMAVGAERIDVTEESGGETLKKRPFAGLIGINGGDGEMKKGVLSV